MSKEIKPDCSQHKKDLFGQTDMKLVAEAIGDLNYEALTQLFYYLGAKLYDDAAGDTMSKRFKLGQELFLASDCCREVSARIHNAWQISKPYMNETK